MHTGSEAIGELIRSIGDLYINSLHFFFVRILGFVTKPLVFLLKFIIAVSGAVGRQFIMLFTPEGADRIDYEKRVVKGIKTIFRTMRKHPFSAPSVIIYYFKKNLRGRRFTVKKAAMWAIPLVTAAVFFLLIRVSANYDMALELKVGGETIGYVSDEKTYIDARNKAADILTFGGNTGNADKLPEVNYGLAVVGINKFSDADTLSEELLKKSEVKLTPACAIYIDGEFIGAVNNESRARAVFKEILAGKSNGEDEHIVAFAQDIDFVQGYYPDDKNIMLTVPMLREKLTKDSSEAVYYTASYGDTLHTVSAATGVGSSVIKELNPGLTENMVISSGTKILVAEETSYLKLKVLKTEVTSAEVDYESIEVESNKLYSGSKKIISSGQKGVAQVTNLVSYVDGEVRDTKELSRIVVVQPTPERVQIGTRPLDESYSVSMGGILVWPTVGAYGINSGYGYRWGKLHAGLDIGMGGAAGTSLGKPVVAAASGTVVTASVHSSYGYYLIIDHGGGMQTLYAHCLAESFMVSPGQTVIAGQPIARVGSTGYSTGPHLHFEVRINGNRVNPYPYLGLS